MIPYILAAVGGYLIGDSLKGKQYAYGGELESDRKKALEWWSSLSINEQKEYSRKHLSPYNYDLIWDYSLSKHISPKKYYDLRVEIWKKETKDGGMMANGGIFGNKKYRFIYEKNGEVHGINYELIGIQADGTEDVISEHITQFGAEKKAKNWQKTASPKYVSWEIRIKKFADGGMMAKGGAVKRFVEMKGDKPVYALADAIYHVSFGTLNDKGFPVTTGTHKVYRTASGLKKIKEYKNNPEYSVLEEKTDDKGIWHITFVANKSFMMDGKETKDVVSFDRDDLYANGGMTGGKIIEDEIFEAINKIYSDPNNKDRYGQVSISEYTEYKLKKMLSDSAFDYLKSGKSAYGKFSTYGGRFGTYSALNPTSEFYQRKKKFADGGVMEEKLEKVNVYNDLDEFEYRQYKRMVDSGMSKVDALKVIINDVEGDTSQLSKKLASIAKKIKYADGGKTEPELPHRYKIGDKVTFMNADYSTGSGKIVKQEVRYINMGGYNLYMVELENGKITPVAESDILDDYSKNRKFYNPD